MRALAPIALGLLLAGCGTSTSSAPTAPACDDLRALNAAARGGGFDEATRACVQARVADASDPDRVALSRLLLWEARSLDDDLATWRALAEQHLAIAPDDVRVISRLANVAERGGPARADEALQWAERGLAVLERDPSAGDARARVDLLKTRTLAAHMKAPPTAPLETRDRVARYARDWVLAARAAELRDTEALLSCTNAGGSEAFCTGETDVLRPGGE